MTIKHFLQAAEKSQNESGKEVENLAIVVTGSETGKFGQAGESVNILHGGPRLNPVKLGRAYGVCIWQGGLAIWPGARSKERDCTSE